MCQTQFAARVLGRGVPHVFQTDWATAAESVDAVLPHAVTSFRADGYHSALLELGDGVVAAVTVGYGRLTAQVAADAPALLAEAEAWLRAAFPQAVSDDRSVPVSFWSYGNCGGTQISRSLKVPSWEEIEANYPAAVRDRLARLVDPSFRPAEGGQLVLWHGPPGTGKTFALRALAWSWRDWCDLHYVVDPEVLFGERADYLLEVVLDEEEDERWRLLVLEDTGELMAADAKARTGQGLSRLLNLVDGIVGQGLRVLVLVTTNEPLRRLHSAVARPGRCAAKIEFAAFPAVEAAAWLAANGLDDARPQELTLANLFALAAGGERAAEPERVLGFS